MRATQEHGGGTDVVRAGVALHSAGLRMRQVAHDVQTVTEGLESRREPVQRGAFRPPRAGGGHHARTHLAHHFLPRLGLITGFFLSF